MSTPTLADQRADRIAARVTGFGAGLITFMLTWTLGARITERMLDTPNSAYAAMIVALVAGVTATIRIAHRLVSSVNTPTVEPQHIERTAALGEQATATT